MFSVAYLFAELLFLRQFGLLGRICVSQAKRPLHAGKNVLTNPKEPPFEPRAKAMISLWMQGGPSHHDHRTIQNRL